MKDAILEDADKKDIAFLVVGDPLGLASYHAIIIVIIIIVPF